MCDGSSIPASFVFHFGNAWEEEDQDGNTLIKMETHQ
jgi:carotenoid cleavage dioxygenase-like enzyme